MSRSLTFLRPKVLYRPGFVKSISQGPNKGPAPSSEVFIEARALSDQVEKTLVGAARDPGPSGWVGRGSSAVRPGAALKFRAGPRLGRGGPPSARRLRATQVALGLPLAPRGPPGS